jgi:hypothetical protein
MAPLLQVSYKEPTPPDTELACAHLLCNRDYM